MPILYVNPSGGRRKKRFAFAKAAKRRVKKASRRKGRMPKALAAYWAKKRSKKKSSRRKARKALSTKRRRRKAKNTGSSKKMAKRKKSRSRRRGRKRSKKSYARAARLGARRRKARKGTSKRRRRGRKSRKGSSRRRRRGRRRSRKSRARAAKLGRRRRRRKMHGPVYRKSRAGRGGTMRGHGPITFVKPNPSRRRRRKGGRRRGRRTAARLGWRRRRRKAGGRKRGRRRSRSGGRRRRYKRFGRLRGRAVYVRNPGQMLIQLAKRAVPIVLATIGAKAITSRIGPRIPMLDRLGTFQGPVLSILTVLGLNFATKKISFLAKHRDAILMGSAIAALHEVISTFAPASVKGMLGMGDTYTQALADYVATNDYEQVADGMSDYVATGDMEQEMGLDQELGFTQEMGDAGVYGQGGLGGARALLAPVPSQRFLAPVPSHSFTAPVPEVTDEYDNPKNLYAGVFAK